MSSGPGAPRAVKCGCHGDLRWRDDAGDAAVGEARLDFRDHHVGEFAHRVGDGSSGISLERGWESIGALT